MDHAEQTSAFVDDIEVESTVIRIRFEPNCVDGFLGGHLLMEGDKMGDHCPARAVRRIEFGTHQVPALARGQEFLDDLAAIVRKVLNNHQHVVDFKSRQQVGKSLVGNVLENLGHQLGGEMRQHRRRPVANKEQVDQSLNLSSAEVGEQWGEGGGMNFGQAFFGQLVIIIGQ